MNVIQLNTALAVIGGLLLILGLTSGVLKQKLLLSEPLVAMLVGVLLGPFGLRVLDIENWEHLPLLLEQAARITLGIALIETALRLPDHYLRTQWKSILLMLLIVMPLMWVASSVIIYAVLGLPLVISFLIGAILAPTDPIIASVIVSGPDARRNIPARIRHLMSAESGINDGIGFLFLMLPMLLLTLPPAHALVRWSLGTILWEVGFAAVFGLALGLLAGFLLRWARQNLAAERVSLQSVGLALSLTTIGVVGLLGGNDVLACFAAGVGLDARVSGRMHEEKAHFHEIIKRFFELPIFVLLGLVIPWQGWYVLGWRAVPMVIAILLLRRIPAMLFARRLIPQIRSLPDALFLGWFGPVGIAALLYANFAVGRIESPTVWIISSMVICASVIVHGITAKPITEWYGRQNGMAHGDTADISDE
jgi:sodium/hydrogen antiporter